MPRSESTVSAAARLRELEIKHSKFYLLPIERWASARDLDASELSRVIGINRKTLRRWSSGASVPRGTTWGRIDAFYRRHRETEPKEDLWETLRR